MATPVDAQTVIAIVTVAASAGAAWAGVKAGLNGTRKSVKDLAQTTTAAIARIEKNLEKHVDAFAHHVESDHSIQVTAVTVNTRLEAKVDGIIEARDERDRQLHAKLDELLKR